MENPEHLRGLRILVVDDEPYILKILVFKLRTAGLVPIEAPTGEDALHAALSERPDAVLLDVSLSPGLSGFDVLGRLKEDPRTASIPVIVLTARSHPDERSTALRLGAARFLTKPFSTNALLVELEGVLTAARGAVSAGPPSADGGPPGEPV
ncbi:MAG: response regulator [Holophagales bacterium]|nr:response regulator [Holophagales bacterium]